MAKSKSANARRFDIREAFHTSLCWFIWFLGKRRRRERRPGKKNLAWQKYRCLTPHFIRVTWHCEGCYTRISRHPTQQESVSFISNDLHHVIFQRSLSIHTVAHPRRGYRLTITVAVKRSAAEWLAVTWDQSSMLYILLIKLLEVHTHMHAAKRTHIFINIAKKTGEQL